MTPEQEKKLNEMYDFIQQLKSSFAIPLDFDQALQGRGYVKTTMPRIPIANPKRGTVTVYGGTANGGFTNQLLTFVDGFLTLS